MDEKTPQTDTILDENPELPTRTSVDEKTPNWLYYGWASSIQPQEHLLARKPQNDYIMDEPPSTHSRITAWKNLTELVHLWMNLQHPPTKAPMGV